MTAVATPDATTRATARPAGPRRRRPRRWPRAVIPFAVLIAFWLGVAVVHSIETPDLDEPGTLSPTGTGDHGSSRLATLLADRGVRVDRVTSSAEALRSAVDGPETTVFVPTPDYLDVRFLERIAYTPSVRRVVVVQPGLRSILFANLPVFVGPGRWATHTGPADCPALPDARPATVLDTVYEASGNQQGMSCYHGSVVGVSWGTGETVYVGASEPFRNDRIGEVGNAGLATELLGGSQRLIWVDVHDAEPLPKFARPELELPRYRRDDPERGTTGWPIFDAFPAWFWAAIALGLMGAILLAVARARRLGPPVAEPIPVIVPAAEAVTGRGRLYERIGARDATLDALRTAAIARMARVLNPFGATTADRDLGRGGAGVDQFVGQIQERTGWPADTVRAVLYDTRPADDTELADAVADLDELVAAILTRGGHDDRNS